MKKLSTIFLLLITLSVCAQKESKATDSFILKGALSNELTFNFADLEKYESTAIDEVSVAKYRDASGSSVKQMKGVLVKDILKGQQYKDRSPKAQTSYNITLKNANGDKVEYSWNNLFNSSIGESVYIITSIDGKAFKDLEDRIVVLTPSSLKTARSFINNLSEIDITK